MKKRLTLHTIFTTLLILTCMTGCNNLALKEVTPGQKGNDSEILHTIHGTCGESPSGSSARTVFPSATAGNVDHYVITATRTSDSKTVTARTAQGESDFSLALPNGTWQFQASGYNAAGEAGETEDNLVLKSAAADPNSRITLSDNTRADSVSITLVVKPVQTDSGTGTIKVNIAFPASCTQIDLIEVQLGQTIEQLQAADFTTSGSDTIATKTLGNISSGSHTLFITFKDASYNKLYRISETVNVFDHLCSDNWVDTGKTGHYKTIGTGSDAISYLYVTQSMIDSFQLTNFYVDPVKGNDSKSGSWLSPFLTLEQALSLVNGKNDGKTYTINLMGDVTVTDATNLELGTTAPNLVIQGDGFNSSGKPYSIDFNGNQGFVITGNNALTFRNICLKGAKTDAGVIDSQSATAQLQYTLEGYVIIEDNLATDGTTVCNLIVPVDAMNNKTKPVRISNTLDSRSRIGVTLSGTQPTANTPVKIASSFSADNNAIPYDVFFSDNNAGIPVLNADNSVSLAQSGGTILAGEDITITLPDYWVQRPDGGTGSLDFAFLYYGWEYPVAVSYSYSVKLIAKGCTYPYFEISDSPFNKGKFTISLPENTPEGIYHLNVNVTVNDIQYSASKEILYSKGQSLSDYAATHTTAPSSGQYVICTKEDLDLLRDMTNGAWKPAGAASAAPATSFSGCTITMVSDIDLENEEWRGIGTYYPSVNFKGTFDGNGHIIKGLKIKGTYAALFGSISEGAVKNLTVSGTSTASGIIYNSYKTTIENCTSNIVYEIKEAGSCITTISYCDTIKNCVNNGSIKVNYSTGQSYFGAIAGSCTGSTIENCSNYGTITIEKSGSGTYICGIAGKMDENRSNSIKNCVNYGTIIAEDTLTNSPCIAGITGLLSQGPITGCSNYGNIIINSQNSISAGGIFYSAPGPSEITDCKNYGNITATGNAGGIAAECTLNYNFVISGCENHGDITSSNANAGGIVASLAFQKGDLSTNKLFNLVNRGDITAKANASGIVNVNSSSSKNFSIINCLNSGNVQTTGTSTEHAAGICTSGKYATLTNCVNTAQVTGSGTYTGGIATGSATDIAGCTFTNCFYNFGKVLSGSYFGTGLGSDSPVTDTATKVEPCGPLFTTTGSRLGISPARNGVSDIAKLLNNNNSSTYKEWGYNTNGELCFTTYTDYTPFVVPPRLTSAAGLSGYTSSDTVQMVLPASINVTDINSLFSSNTNNVKLILDLSSVTEDIFDINETLPNVTELVLPAIELDFDFNKFGQDEEKGGGYAVDLKKVTILGDIGGYWIFQCCTNIETAIFAEGVTAINCGMFAGCTSLKTVILPSTLKTIGFHAFANSAIEEIIIPAGVTEIQHFAFFNPSATDEQLRNLKRVIFEDTTHTWTIKHNETEDIIGTAPIDDEDTAGGDPENPPSDLTAINVSDPERNAEWFKSNLGRSEGYYWVKN